MARLMAIALLLAVPACQGDEAVPSGAQNRQLDGGENLLNAAPDELDTVSERMPQPS